MEVIRQNRLIAAILGGLIVVSALVLIFNDNPEAPRVPASDLANPTATGTFVNPFLQPRDTQDPNFPRPNLEKVDCGEFLIFSELDEAFGTQSWNTRRTAESCVHRLTTDTTTTIRLWPGHPNDFVEGVFEGTPGTPVTTRADAANWFAAQSTLSIAEETAQGIFILRVTVERADVTADERLETARFIADAALPRVPGVVLDPPPPPDPVAIAAPEVPDRSAFGFVQNLLQKEADGDWTRGEGLIATLSLLIGEAEPADVLRTPGFLDTGTATIDLAEQLLEAAPADPSAPEIERLLQLIGDGQPQFSDPPIPDSATQTPTRATETATPAPQTSAGQASVDTPNRRTLAIQQQAPEGDVEWNCFQVRDCLNPTPQGCSFGRWDAENHVDVCWLFNAKQESGENRFRMFVPEVAGLGGWTPTIQATAWDHFRSSFSNITVDGLDLGSIDLNLAPPRGTGSFGSVVMTNGDRRCDIDLQPAWQQLLTKNPQTAKQAIAYLVGQCSVRNGKNFSGGSYGSLWLEGTAFYLSDRVAPDGKLDVELKAVPQLEAEELTTDLRNQDLSAWAFLESVSTPLAVLRWGVVSEQSDERMPELLDFHAKTLSKGSVLDLGGPLPYSPGTTSAISLREQPAHTVTIREYTPIRLQLQVEGDQFACMEYSPFGPALGSWSQGQVGDPSLVWSSDLPSSIEGVSVLVLTSIAVQEVTITATNFVDDPTDCPGQGDRPSSSPPPLGTPCQFCDITDYIYEKAGSLRDAIGR